VESVIVSGGFDDLRSPQVRFLQEAARLGPVRIFLWSDEVLQQFEGKAPKFSQAERMYLLESLRYVSSVTLCLGDRDALPPFNVTRPAIWVVDQANDAAAKQKFCRLHGLEYRVLQNESMAGFPDNSALLDKPGTDQRLVVAHDMIKTSRKRVIVTGCYDWFHSGHVRFFEEVSALGDLYVIVGHDANIELLKGKGHPMIGQEERRYMVQSVRSVKQALISSGHGWLDAEPEILRIKPDIYAVNEDGDRPEKRQYCQSQGIEYRVLRRIPKDGLPRRVSTELRGF
jgi:cytidyltransferase-like protein